MTDRLGNKVKLGDIVVVPQLAGYEFGVIDDMDGDLAAVCTITDFGSYRLHRPIQSLTVVDGDLFSRPSFLNEQLLSFSNLILESEDVKKRLARLCD